MVGIRRYQWLLILLIQACVIIFIDAQPSLFRAFKELEERIPYVELLKTPTPIIHLQDLGVLMSVPSLYCKQDAYLSPVFSGNKARKLEFLLGDARAQKAQRIITVGTAGSNHAAATAAHSKELGFSCSLVLSPQRPTGYTRRNLLVEHAYQAELVHAKDYKNRSEKVLQLANYYLKHEHIKPYVIPAGGATAYGVLGFVNAVYELKEQIERGEMPEPDLLVVPIGTGGTVAGLLLGIKMCGLKTKVLAVSVESTSTVAVLTEKIEHLFAAGLEVLIEALPVLPHCALTTDDYVIDVDHTGDGYAHITPETAEAILLLNTAAHIKLDGTYAGKAFAALLDYAQKKDNDLTKKTVLFWNTFSSGDLVPAGVATNYKNLPPEFHGYFEKSLQALDQGY